MLIHFVIVVVRSRWFKLIIMSLNHLLLTRRVRRVSS